MKYKFSNESLVRQVKAPNTVAVSSINKIRYENIIDAKLEIITGATTVYKVSVAQTVAGNPVFSSVCETESIIQAQEFFDKLLTKI